MPNTKISIKAISEDTVTVAGYGVVFGGVDLDGETFSKSTDFMLDLVPEKLVLYDHGGNEAIKANVIGHVKAGDISADDDGLWIEAELNRHASYMAHVLKLIEEGVLGWSSGSVGHLTAREGKSIKRWPIVEFSLTPTPAEPRTLGVNRLKTLADAAPALEQLATAPETVADDIESEPTKADGETEEPEGARAAPATVPDAEDEEDSQNRVAQRLMIELELMEIEQ